MEDIFLLAWIILLVMKSSETQQCLSVILSRLVDSFVLIYVYLNCLSRRMQIYLSVPSDTPNQSIVRVSAKPRRTEKFVGD